MFEDKSQVMRLSTENSHKLVRDVTALLKSESSEWRPPDSKGLPGGLVNLLPKLPTFILPDLHGRFEFLTDLMEYEHEGESVQSLLDAGKIQLICVGDGMHGESRAAMRWRKAFCEYRTGFEKSSSMAEEMDENFQTMFHVMSLKLKYPRHFHFLKGNHENIMAEEGHGNHSFAKYALEAIMTRDYVRLNMGKEFLIDYARFEKQLPLLAVGDSFVISHARPADSFQVNDLIEYRHRPEIVESLTWTRNYFAKQNSCREVMTRLFENIEGKWWFVGHTPIAGLYEKLEREQVVQIHNPEKRPVVIINPDRAFDPDRDIIELEQEVEVDELDFMRAWTRM